MALVEKGLQCSDLKKERGREPEMTTLWDWSCELLMARAPRAENLRVIIDFEIHLWSIVRGAVTWPGPVSFGHCSFVALVGEGAWPWLGWSLGAQAPL